MLVLLVKREQVPECRLLEGFFILSQTELSKKGLLIYFKMFIF